jgi:hypothetical protein
VIAGCAAAPPKEPPGPDAKALAMETLVQARAARVVLSLRWRAKAKVEGIRVDEGPPGTQVARGGAVVQVEKLRVEAEEISVTWLNEEHQDLVLSASDVKLFRQRRAQPYEITHIAMLTMANDQMSFLYPEGAGDR